MFAHVFYSRKLGRVGKDNGRLLKVIVGIVMYILEYRY